MHWLSTCCWPWRAVAVAFDHDIAVRWQSWCRCWPPACWRGGLHADALARIGSAAGRDETQLLRSAGAASPQRAAEARRAAEPAHGRRPVHRAHAAGSPVEPGACGSARARKLRYPRQRLNRMTCLSVNVNKIAVLRNSAVVASPTCGGPPPRCWMPVPTASRCTRARRTPYPRRTMCALARPTVRGRRRAQPRGQSVRARVASIPAWWPCVPWSRPAQVNAGARRGRPDHLGPRLRPGSRRP
jgi:hypothetical protein